MIETDASNNMAGLMAFGCKMEASTIHLLHKIDPSTA